MHSCDLSKCRENAADAHVNANARSWGFRQNVERAIALDLQLRYAASHLRNQRTAAPLPELQDLAKEPNAEAGSGQWSVRTVTISAVI